MAKAPATCLGCFYHPGKRKSGSEASKSGFKGWKKPWWEQLLSWGLHPHLFPPHFCALCPVTHGIHPLPQLFPFLSPVTSSACRT